MTEQQDRDEIQRVRDEIALRIEARKVTAIEDIRMWLPVLVMQSIVVIALLSLILKKIWR